MGGKRYTKKQLKWIEKNVNNYINYKDMTDAFNLEFGESRTEQGISNTVTKRLKLNKNLNYGQFSNVLKKEELPLGTIRRTGNGVTYVKTKLTGENRPKYSGYKEPYWMPLQKKIYVDEHGDIKDDEMIIFLDCNRYNFSLDNLCCIDRRISAILAKNKWYSENPEITKTGIMCAKIILKIGE